MGGGEARAGAKSGDDVVRGEMAMTEVMSASRKTTNTRLHSTMHHVVSPNGGAPSVVAGLVHILIESASVYAH